MLDTIHAGTAAGLLVVVLASCSSVLGYDDLSFGTGGADAGAGADSGPSPDAHAGASGSSTPSDPCAEHGWYGDGICDDFCPQNDPDCGGGGADAGWDPCDDNGWYGDGTCHTFCAQADPDCVPSSPPTTGCWSTTSSYDACVQCCRGEHPQGAQDYADDQLACACGGACTAECTAGCSGQAWSSPCLSCVRDSIETGACPLTLCNADPECWLYVQCGQTCE